MSDDLTARVAELAAAIEAKLAEDERVAKGASGGTVIGEPGNWKPAPTGDEWEVHADVAEGDFGPDGDLEVLVALRPGLSPETSEGYWGAVVSWTPDLSDSDAWVPEPQFRHIARHDPARALRRVKAVRNLVAEILGEQHYSAEVEYYSCSQAQTGQYLIGGPTGPPGSGCSDPERAGKPCDCGRDARVARLLGIIASEWEVQAVEQ